MYEKLRGGRRRHVNNGLEVAETTGAAAAAANVDDTHHDDYENGNNRDLQAAHSSYGSVGPPLSVRRIALTRAPPSIELEAYPPHRHDEEVLSMPDDM